MFVSKAPLPKRSHTKSYIEAEELIDKKEYLQAQAILEEIIKNADKVSNATFYDVYRALGFLDLMFFANFESARDYYLRALEYAEKNKSLYKKQFQVSYVLYQLSICYRLLKNREEELKMLKAIIENCHYEDKPHHYRDELIHRKAVCLLNRGLIYESYTSEKDLQNALADYQSAKKLLNDLSFDYMSQYKNEIDEFRALAKKNHSQLKRALNIVSPNHDSKESSGYTVQIKKDKIAKSARKKTQVLEHVPNNTLSNGIGALDAHVKHLQEDNSQAYEKKFSIQHRPYQKACIAAIAHALNKDQRTGFVHMATGTGKTLTFLSMIKAMQVETLIVAPTTLLLEQVKDALSKYVPHLCVGVFDGVRKQIGANVTLTTYASLEKEAQKKPEERTLQFDVFNMALFDEAHCGLTKKRAYAIREIQKNACTIGFTATPEYQNKRKTGDYYSCKELFGDKLFEYGINEGVRDGYLTPYRMATLRIHTDHKLSTSKKRLGSNKPVDYTDQEIATYINHNDAIYKAVVDMIATQIDPKTEKRFSTQSAIIFTPDIDTADKMVMHLNQRFGENYARALHSGLDDKGEQASKILAAHKQGCIKTVVTPLMGALGYDNPDITLGIDMRPTRSALLKQQKFGRLLRTIPKHSEYMKHCTNAWHMCKEQRNEQQKEAMLYIEKLSVLWIDYMIEDGQLSAADITQKKEDGTVLYDIVFDSELPPESTDEGEPFAAYDLTYPNPEHRVRRKHARSFVSEQDSASQEPVLEEQPVDNTNVFAYAHLSGAVGSTKGLPSSAYDDFGPMGDLPGAQPECDSGGALHLFDPCFDMLTQPLTTTSADCLSTPSVLRGSPSLSLFSFFSARNTYTNSDCEPAQKRPCVREKEPDEYSLPSLAQFSFRP